MNGHPRPRAAVKLCRGGKTLHLRRSDRRLEETLLRVRIHDYRDGTSDTIIWLDTPCASHHLARFSVGRLDEYADEGEWRSIRLSAHTHACGLAQHWEDKPESRILWEAIDREHTELVPHPRDRE